jgi:hypothetical protein
MAADLTTLANVKQWLGISGLPISAITNANPAVVTLVSAPPSALPLMTGMVIGFEGVNGMSGLNGNQFAITTITASSFSIPFDSTGAGAYTGGGYAGISDQLLTRLIHAVSTFIQNYITRPIAAATYIETRNGLGQTVMALKNAPVQSVASVSIDGRAIPPRPPLGATSLSYCGGWSNDDVAVYLSGYTFCRGAQNVVVTYTAGYSTTPPDIEQAAIDMIGDWFRYMNRIGKLSEGIEGQTITFTNTAISARAMGVLNVYNQRAPIGP